MPTTYDFDLICLGSGPAGQRAAVQAAKLLGVSRSTLYGRLEAAGRKLSP